MALGLAGKPGRGRPACRPGRQCGGGGHTCARKVPEEQGHLRSRFSRFSVFEKMQGPGLARIPPERALPLGGACLAQAEVLFLFLVPDPFRLHWSQDGRAGTQSWSPGWWAPVLFYTRINF